MENVSSVTPVSANAQPATVQTIPAVAEVKKPVKVDDVEAFLRGEGSGAGLPVIKAEARYDADSDRIIITIPGCFKIGETRATSNKGTRLIHAAAELEPGELVATVMAPDGATYPVNVRAPRINLFLSAHR